MGIDRRGACQHTNQGYVLKFPRDVDPEGNQDYTDVLPSFHAKYGIHRNANLRFSYARAINRPSFFEIVPYSIINEDYKEKGNPDLKHTVADNIDLRYEFFQSLPSSLWSACSIRISRTLSNTGC